MNINLLIWISGYFWGTVLLNSVLKGGFKNTSNRQFAIVLTMWLMTWAWICWKFIN